MKRVAILLFTVFYMLPVIGFSIDVHWCGNKVNSIKIVSDKEEKCPCGKKMKNGCCKDTHTFIKLTDNQKAGSTLTTFINHPLEISLFIISKTNLFSSRSEICNFSRDHAPPYKSKHPVYFACNVFRI
jgi:hypothetical protein